MTRLALALVLILGLTSCSGALGIGPTGGAQPELTPTQKVFSLKGQYEAILIPIEKYESQPRCTEVVVIACSDTVLVEKFRASIRRIRAMLDAAEVNVRANPTQPPSAAVVAVIREGLIQLNTYVIEMSIGGTS